MVTKALADQLLQQEKVIAANLVWRQSGQSYRLEARALATSSGELLRLVGFVGIKNRSYALLHRNTPIRKYTVHDRHTNPNTGQVLREPHKHYWDDEWEDHLAYVPHDIRQGNPNEEILDFLKECNITLRGSYTSQEFPVQGDMGVS